MPFRPAVVLLLLLLVAFSGCAGKEGAEKVDDDVVLVTDPNQQITADQRPHLHDYWGGRETLTVMDTELEAPGYLWFGDDRVESVAMFRPDSGDVIPQGAAFVNVTISWDQEGDDNRYQTPQLWYKSAADAEIAYLADLPGPEPTTVSIPTTNAMNDLPHQVLSAWQFDLMLAGTPLGTVSPLPTHEARFTGMVHIKVSTDRGLEIPLYPGHPDRWNGVDEIELFEADVSLLYDGDATTTNWRCYGGCPVTHIPGDFIVVPYDASHITVEIDLTYGAPSRLGLKVHGADAREFTALTPHEDETNRRVYDIPVEDAGDGPYAIQSQWEFVPFVESPQENGYIFEEYHIKATVYRDT